MPVDIFATKGTEYLLVVVYFVLLIALVRYLAPRTGRAAAAARPSRDGDAWLPMRDDRHFHRGHSWVAAGAGEGDLVTVGMDDFAALTLGDCDGVELPAVGSAVRQGGPGWTVVAGGRRLAMVSPVWGEVVAVNRAVVETPRLAASDPYGAGWLLKVRAPDRPLWVRNLLCGDLAAFWRRDTLERLRRMETGALGVVMSDGGAPARGFARAVDDEQWQVIAREFFLTG